METVAKINENLSQAHGTENYYRYHRLLVTDGVMQLANDAECFWLLNLVYSWATTKLKKQTFLVYKMEVKDDSAVVTIDDGNDNILGTQNIEFTDFPLPEITIWCVDGVMLLPSEY